jgi:hypothetical protein
MSWRQSSRCCTGKPHNMNDSEQRKPPPSAEQARLADSSTDMPGDWKAIGPYVSERAWGTVREDYSADGQAWKYFPYETRALARLPLERGRPRRPLRPIATPLFCAGLLEWARPIPEGAYLRPQRAGGKSWRGRQGVLVVQRGNADRFLAALALPLSTGRIPLFDAAARKR